MQRLLTGFAFLAFAMVQAGAANADPMHPWANCSANNPPVLVDVKTKTYMSFPAATSASERSANIAKAKKVMAANPDITASCTMSAVRMGAHKANGFGGVNSVPSPAYTGAPGKSP
jgi:hypothetical protein